MSKFTCKVCDYIANESYTLRQHELFFHKIVSVDQEKIENRFFKCRFCPKDHEMISLGQKKKKIKIEKCAFCPKKFNNKGTLIAHIKSKHKDNYKKHPSKRPCEQCFYLAENNTTLREHKISDHNMTTFEWTMTPNAPQPNDPQAESEIEVIVSPNIERPPPEKVKNTQQLPSREEEDLIICLESRVFKDFFFFHKSMQCKQGIKRKFNPDEDENEENANLPKKKMRITMKKMWNFLQRSKETKSNFQEKRPKKLNLEGFLNLNNKLKKTVQTEVK